LVLLSVLLGGVSAYAASTGSFQPVGTLTTARWHPTATLLNDGTVLVTGGLYTTGSFNQTQRTTERFDPQSNTFSAVRPMTFPRSGHAAVRLPDGRVLVVGGSNDLPLELSGAPSGLSFLIATAEVYDPATGRFSTTGDLITPRLNSTATLVSIPQGPRVLVVGGRFLDTVETAELFDPATEQFTQAAPMALGRSQHAAVLLKDGRVALLGGYHRTDGPQRSVEIYDPRTNTFTPAGQMAEARAEFQATLLPDGRILATGGIGGPPDASGRGTTALSSVESYNPATGQSTVTDHLTGPRFDHGAVALADGRVLVIGGEAALNGSTPLSTAALVDPATGKVSPASPTVGTRGVVPTLLPDGRVLIIGGQLRFPFAEVFMP
jgi:hypothetical protein